MKKKAITKAIFVNHLNETIGFQKENVRFFLKLLLEVLMNSLKQQKRCKNC